jgi:fatty acid desaturase
MNLPSLCPYKNALGIPGKGVHSYRLFNIAIMDVIMTIIGALVISYLLGWKFGWTLLGLFILGIILHRLFCVRTTIDKLLFPE